MRKAKVVTNYSHEKQTDLEPFATSVYNSLKTNADYPTPPVLMPAFLLLTTDYHTKLALAEHGTPIQTAAKNASKHLLLDALSKNAVYVNATANGDEVKLQGSGYRMAKMPQPKGPLAIPSLFKVTASPEPGRAVVEFSGLPNATYMVRLTSNAATDRNLWPTTVDTRRSFNVNGLISGTRYTFIGAYKGASNVLNFSAPVEVVVQ